MLKMTRHERLKRVLTRLGYIQSKTTLNGVDKWAKPGSVPIWINTHRTVYTGPRFDQAVKLSTPEMDEFLKRHNG